MAAFSHLDWSRFDVWAAVATDGIAAVDKSHRESCLNWLRQREYTVESIDFGRGIGHAIRDMNELFRWEQQFGYTLKPDRCNLDALRDGFEFDLKPGCGKVFELLNIDVAYVEDGDWLFGLLAIAREYSRSQLALGARFFTVLYLNHDSVMIGKTYESLSIPTPYWTVAAKADPFAS